MRKGHYGRAIKEALIDAMRADPRVRLFGQDIGYGGVLGITKNLLREFGPERVVDTPLAENLILGEAIGNSAYFGQRVIAEMQFADFVSVGFAQLTQVAAPHYFRTGIPVPIVVRLPYGATGAGGHFHSQSPESWFLNSPGLKFAFPATPEDAYGLLRTAIVDPNPVLYFEHKRLYWDNRYIGTFAEPGEPNEFIPFGKAILRREGNDCLLISYGAMVWLSMEAAETLAKVGIECSVLDLRTLIPLDEDQLTKLAREIGKVVIIHEAPKKGGPGGWIAQTIREADQGVLVETVGAKYTPIPSSPILEKDYLPSTQQIVEAVRKLAVQPR